MSDITEILNAIRRGDNDSRGALFDAIYRELRKVAANMMAREAAGHTLQPTALVNEAWLRISEQDGQSWQNRAHFFGAAGEAMRRILIEQARRRQAARRGGGERPGELDGVEIATEMADGETLAVHEALDKFSAAHPRKADLVKLRYFAGFTVAQAAEALDISEKTAKRDWAFSRAWLGEEIRAAG